MVDKHNPQLIFLGSNTAEDMGLEVLEKIQKGMPRHLIFYMHPAPDHHLAIKVLKAGAYYLLHKPNDFPELAHQLGIHLRYLLVDTPSLEGEEQKLLQNIIGNSSACKKIKQDIRHLAPLDVTVLIQGESGTGKDLVAKALHDLSKRKNSPFIPVNCGALPLALFESEFFGSCRGAYTGATNRKGYFEKSRGGTLFLDEIAEIRPAGQVKLLRVLEEKRVTPLGSSESIPVDTRILTATNCSLSEKIKQRQLRIDFLFRINTATITVPPLRKRREDILPLSEHFLKRMTFLPIQKNISIDALEKLNRHDWPGNIRELRNVVESASIRCPDLTIQPHHIEFFNL